MVAPGTFSRLLLISGALSRRILISGSYIILPVLYANHNGYRSYGQNHQNFNVLKSIAPNFVRKVMRKCSEITIDEIPLDKSKMVRDKLANISEDERAAWPKLSDGFLAMALASFRLFVAGEELFMAADADGWKDTVSVLFGERGLGSPSKVKSVDDYGGVELHYDWLPFMPITVGMIAAAWTRCEGRPVKVQLSVNKSGIIVGLSSRYELA